MTGSERPTVGQYRPRVTAAGGLEAVRIRLLGGFRVTVGSSRSIGEDRWHLRKARSLVELLALSPGHRLHRERATDLLWPELDTRAAANNLHHALHVARRILEPSAGAVSGYLQLRDEQLTLCPDGPLWVDVEAFEAAATTARHALEAAAYRAAIDLYPGELLPQDRYEPWVEQRRAELRELHLSLLVELAGLYEELGEYGASIEAWSRAATEEPAHEGAHVGLMRVYALLGRRREALGQYERLREALSREFGTEPQASARYLQQEIWAGTFPPAPPPPSEGPPSEEPPSATGVARHNLPFARTSFVGRERETLEVRRLLAMTGLLTLTGAGGSGKTRLALKVARDLVGAYPDGVWLVELAPFSDPALVSQAVAQALGVREIPGRSLEDTLTDHLRRKNLLLVVDNCEHLVDPVAHLAEALLRSCPRLRILATSREPLGVRSEAIWTVPPLAVPDEEGAPTVEGVMLREAARLFVERAHSRLPGFEVTTENAGAVARVCRKLDGMPLAIELAAARMGALAVGQVAQRLEDSLKLLTGGGRTVEPRQQTLRATLDWSHDLLDEAEKALFRRLSVFAGGWTLEAAEAVCPGEGIERDEVLDLLSRLVDKSLVVAETTGDEASRYRMLEPVRQYAHERLDDSGETGLVRGRHARYFLEFAQAEDAAEADERQIVDARPVAWVGRMEGEHANLGAALDWSLGDAAGDVELGVRLAVALFWFWNAHHTEGRRRLERAARATSDPATARWRARASNGASYLSFFQQDLGVARALEEEAVALYREAQDEEGIAIGLVHFGMIGVLGQRDDVPVAAVLEELEERKLRLKNRATLGHLLMLEGLVALMRGDFGLSAALHEECLELFREIGDTQGITTALVTLGGIALARDDHEAAEPVVREALRLGREMDMKPVVQHCLYELGCVADNRERPVEAARLWGAVEGLREAYGLHLTPATLTIAGYEDRLAAAREAIGEEMFAAAWEEGKEMPLERAIEYALSEGEEQEPPALVPVVDATPSVDERKERLTPREHEVALLVAQGSTNRRIAQELSISERTVENHVHKILKKLNFSSRSGIAAWVARQW